MNSFAKLLFKENWTWVGEQVKCMEIKGDRLKGIITNKVQKNGTKWTTLQGLVSHWFYNFYFLLPINYRQTKAK